MPGRYFHAVLVGVEEQVAGLQLGRVLDELRDDLLRALVPEVKVQRLRRSVRPGVGPLGGAIRPRF